MLTVEKRDGRVVPFDRDRIVKAVDGARREVDMRRSPSRLGQTVAAEVVASMLTRGIMTITIAEIQSFIEDYLMEKYPDVARAYIEYRSDRDRAREHTRSIERPVDGLVDGDKLSIRENANKDSSFFGTQRDLNAGAASKTYALANMLPRDVATAHREGEIHYHDLDYHPFQPMTNCCLVDVEGMFRDGFKIGNAEVETPKSISVAASQLYQIIAAVASSQYGGTSINRVDEVMAPYAEMSYQKRVRRLSEEFKSVGAVIDTKAINKIARNQTVKEVYDSFQLLEYSINSLHTSNGQTPFVTFGFGLGEGFWEREIQKAIFEVRLDGLGAKKYTAIFPKLVYTLKRGFNLNEGDANFDITQLAAKTSVNRIYPDVISFDKLAEITGSSKAPMGCRSFLPKWVNPETGIEETEGRNNLGVVTLNIPRIAIESYGRIDNFWALFDKRMEVMKQALVYRAKRCEQARPEYAPILYRHGALGKRIDLGDDVKGFFRDHRATLSVGYIGLYEAAAEFYGPNWEKNDYAKNFTLEILRRMNAYVKAWREEYPWWFSVYATPSESLTDRFCRIDTAKFGKIKDVTDKGYYTNSFHYDVRKSPTVTQKLKFEAPYAELSPGGFIHYCEYPKLKHNPEALISVWQWAYDVVAYLGTNTPIDKCYECDFEGEFVAANETFKCPQCGNSNPETCDVVKRTCGYLGQMNLRAPIEGRYAEIASRVSHANDVVK